jgi:hypothetical protein
MKNTGIKNQLLLNTKQALIFSGSAVFAAPVAPTALAERLKKNRYPICRRKHMFDIHCYIKHYPSLRSGNFSVHNRMTSRIVVYGFAWQRKFRKK